MCWRIALLDPEEDGALLERTADKVYEQFFGKCQTDAEYKAANEAMVQAFGEEIAQKVADFCTSN